MLTINRNDQGDCTKIPDYVNTFIHTANTSHTETVPAGAQFVVISANLAIQVSKVPPAIQTAKSDGTGSFLLNPSDEIDARTFSVAPGDTFATIGAATGSTPIVTYSYFGA